MNVLPLVKKAILVGATAVVATACTATVGLPAGAHLTVSTTGKPATTTATTLANPTTSTAATTAAAVANLQNQFVNVVKTAQPSVVQVQTNAGLGSGIVYDSKGDIVTNAHVVGSSTAFTITTSTGVTAPATLVGVDTSNDLAVIHTAATGLQPATFADSARLQVGDLVLALGSPFGLQGSVTQGMVSALNRDVAESRTVALTGLIQTSAPINPGNSGGALTDLVGQVVGIPTLGATTGNGIGFAIPSDTVVTVANHLIGVSG